MLKIKRKKIGVQKQQSESGKILPLRPRQAKHEVSVRGITFRLHNKGMDVIWCAGKTLHSAHWADEDVATLLNYFSLPASEALLLQLRARIENRNLELAKRLVGE